MGLRTINRQRKKTILEAEAARKKLHGLATEKMDISARMSRESRYQIEFDRHYAKMILLDEQRRELIRDKQRRELIRKQKAKNR